MKHDLLLRFICVCLCVSACGSARAQTEITVENLKDEHVRAAIRAMVTELYDRQDVEHQWEPVYSGDFERDQGGGWTALVALSLLYAGETYQDERLSKAIRYLEEVEMKGTYAIAIRAHVWALLPPKFEPLLEKDKRWLLESFSDRAAGWYYTRDPDTTRKDHSIAQYGALGLWECAKRGSRVDTRYWRMLEDAFITRQLRDGGWNYDGTGPSYGSMTAAGLTVLYITQDFLHAHEAVKLERGGPSENEKAIDRGIEWFTQNFSAEHNPGRAGDYYYYLYGVERVGLAGGIRYFGDHDWFREGAVELIRRLCDWDPETGEMAVYERTGGDGNAGEIRTVDLSFALMFLSRGRVPGSINKLSDPSFAWNNRPRDVANLTNYIRAKSEAGINWGVVSINAPPEEWLTAPMLYLASNEAPAWMNLTQQQATDLRAQHAALLDAQAGGAEVGNLATELGVSENLTKLKTFIELGGTVFANAEGRSRAFVDAVERAGLMLFPHYEWRDVPADHPLYSIYQPGNPDRASLRALSNGVRELMILSPSVDFSEFLQSNSTNAEEHFAMGMNVYLYASEMNRSHPRVATHVLDREEIRVAGVPISIVHASHGGSWNVEPRSLDVFSAWAWNERGIDLQIRTAPLATIHAVSPATTLVIVNGVDAVAFSDDEIAAICAFAEAGGTILFETVGGIGEFTASAEKQIRETLSNPVRALMRHPVVTGENVPGTSSISRVEYRPYAFTVFGARETAPRLRGMFFEGDEPRILFSREDVSHGLLNQPCWAIAGYASPFARDLLANILRYAHASR